MWVIGIFLKNYTRISEIIQHTNSGIYANQYLRVDGRPKENAALPPQPAETNFTGKTAKKMIYFRECDLQTAVYGENFLFFGCQVLFIYPMLWYNTVYLVFTIAV